MSIIENRLARLESLRAPIAAEYRWDESMSAEDNEHFKALHDMLTNLGPAGLDALFADIAANGRRLVPEIAQ